MAGRRHAVAGPLVACLAGLLLVAVTAPAVTSAAPDCQQNPNHRDCRSPLPGPTEDCGAAGDGAVSSGDVDRDCDGTLVGFDTESGRGGTIRDAEVLVEVSLADPDSLQQVDEHEPTRSSATTDDADQLVLADAPRSTQGTGARWDPPWLAWLTGLAIVLVGLAVAWWLFLVVRVQDRWDG